MQKERTVEFINTIIDFSNGGSLTISYKCLNVEKSDVNSDEIKALFININDDCISSLDFNNYNYLDINSLPCDEIGQVCFQLSLTPFNIRGYESLTELADSCFGQINSDAKNLIDNNYSYLIEKKIYSAKEVLEIPKIRKINQAYEIIKGLKAINDLEGTGFIVLIGGVPNIARYDKGLSCDYELPSIDEKSLSIFNDVIKSSEKDLGLVQLLKSEINNHTMGVTTALERTYKMLELFSEIIESFLFSKSKYYERFNSEVIKKEYQQKELNYGNSLRSSLSNLKTELVAFLSVFLAITGIEFSKGLTDVKNLLIFLGVCIVVFITGALLVADLLELFKVNKSIKNEICSIRNLQLGDYILKEFKKLHIQAFINILILLGSLISLFIPILLTINSI